MFTKLYCAAISAKTHFAHRFREETGDTGLVVMLIMIAIAVGLAFVFRDQISELLTSVFGRATEAVSDLSTPS